MLNYIWAGLIVSSLVFALFFDVRDLTRDTYRNGTPLPVALDFEDRVFDPDAEPTQSSGLSRDEIFGLFQLNFPGSAAA